MEIDEKEIPSIHKLSEYIEYFKRIYDALFNDKQLTITNIEVLEQHFANNFNTLRFKMDEDLFQYNHAMIVFIVLCTAYNRMDIGPCTDTFLKQHLILPGNQSTLANNILNLHILHNAWKEFDLHRYDQVQQYVRRVHKSVAAKVIFADNLQRMNRLNMIKKVGNNLFCINTKCMMMLACHVAENLQQLAVGDAVHSYATHDPVYTFSDYQMNTFFKWATAETTYFQIRNFRTRILNIFYLFVFDEPARNLYTYNRAGEIPSVTAVVTAKFPSNWTSAMQHVILYGKPHELLGHDNLFIRNAALIALLEAFMKTIYSVNFSKFCVCMNFDIQKHIKHIMLSEHPILLLAWHKFYIAVKGKVYMYATLEESLLAWLFHLKDDCRCMLFGQISLLKICNTLCVGATQEEEEETNEEFIEIDI
tara:strand:- start:3310 stop:4569 length:1260 start_codon:yes stop_codon:yes gene_type:complete